MQRDNRNRIAFLDVAKGMGIVLVLVGHNIWSLSKSSAVIFNFHMPLFYFLSGLFFSGGKAGSSKNIVHRVYSIMASYVFFAMIAVFAFAMNPDLGREFSKKTLYTFLVHGEPWFDKPLWFFVSLAGVVLTFSYASRLLGEGASVFRRAAFLAVSLALSLIVSETPSSFRKVYSPAMLATIPAGVFFYALGWFSKGFVERLKNMDADGACRLRMAAAAIALLAVLAFACDVATKPDVRTARIGSWLMFPRAMCGIAAVVLLARAMPGRAGLPLAQIGRNSMVFFSLEFVTFPYVAKALCRLAPGYRHVEIAESTPLWQSCLAVVAQIAVLSALSPSVSKLLSKWKLIADKLAPPPPPADSVGRCRQTNSITPRFCR